MCTVCVNSVYIYKYYQFDHAEYVLVDLFFLLLNSVFGGPSIVCPLMVYSSAPLRHSMARLYHNLLLCPLTN